MKIFGYGSLMNNDSLEKSFDSFEVLGIDTLSGYYRIFDFESPYRHNAETKIYSCVLNLRLDKHTDIYGTVIEIPESEINELMSRERGYDCIPCKLGSGEIVNVFMSEDNEIYDYVFGDPIQNDYLELCLIASKEYGEHVYENFINTTFLKEGLSVREYLS